MDGEANKRRWEIGALYSLLITRLKEKSMKKLVIIILVLVVIGLGFYYGYQNGQSSKQKMTLYGLWKMNFDKAYQKAKASRSSNITRQNMRANIQFSTQDTTAVKEVAVNFFQACTTGDWDKAFAFYPMRDDQQKESLKDYLGGMEIISIGEPYRKIPSYAGLYIPCEIKLKSGEIKKYDLAIRNDNPSKTWQMDGGI